jgi:uncharacterized protein YcaQ
VSRVWPLSREEARAYLVAHLGLARPRRERGARGVRAMLDDLACVQIDPLDPMGTNADLVALARVDGIARGDVFDHTLPGYAFEHWAKERCLLPAPAFAHYRTRVANGDGGVVETPWWRTSDRAARLPAGVLEAVRDEIAARGPVAASALSDRGRVQPFDWAGWRGTAKAASMAIEVLWTRCEIVVAARRGREKLWALPACALPDHHDAMADGEFDRWAIAERVRAAGLLPQGGGAAWSTTLRAARSSGVVDEMLGNGTLEEVVVDRTPTRRLLAPRGAVEQKRPTADDRMRILGPLDPLLWDRDLVRTVFGFEYLWEVYKPATERRWGWYVVPLLHRGRLVGRLEGRVIGTTLAIARVWRERSADFDEDALDAALERHAVACGCNAVRRASRARRR